MLYFYCNGCGEFFETDSRSKLWCSKKCEYRWRHPRPDKSTCKYCKEEFASDYDSRRILGAYCSDNCRQADWKQQFYAKNGYEYSYNTYQRAKQLFRNNFS